MERANKVAWFNLVGSLLAVALCFESLLHAQPPTAAPVPVAPVPVAPAPVAPLSPQLNGGSPFGPSGPDLGAPVTPPQPDGAAHQLTGRPALAHEALNRAIECFHRGDFEAAAPLFEEALRRKEDLFARELPELNRFLQQNTTALQSRRDGTDNLRLAEKALNEGRTAEAQDRLRKVAVNEQYLTPGDRQRYQALSAPKRTVAAEAATPGADPAQMSRELVQQARQMLAQYQFEAAEKLAQDAIRLNQTCNRSDNAQTELLRDVTKARNDPKMLLAAARTALGRQDFDQAEKYAKLAGEVSSRLTYIFPWGDSPTKVLKDVQTARAKVAQGPQSPFLKAPDSPGDQPQNTAAPAKESSGLFGWSLFGGKNKDAQQPASGDTPTTTGSGPLMPPWPGKETNTAAGQGPAPTPPTPAVDSHSAVVQVTAGSPPNDQPVQGTPPVAGAGVVSGPAGAKPTASTGPSLPPDGGAALPADETEKARGLLAQARVAMQQGNYARARELNEQARGLHANLPWWEDNPSRVGADIVRLDTQAIPAGGLDKAGTKPRVLTGQQAKDEAVALIVKGRAQMNEGIEKKDRGKLDEATQTLLKIRTLHVTKWGMFDYTDEKLRQDLEKARLKFDQEESNAVLAEARRLFKNGDLDNALRAAYRAQKLHGTYPRWDFISDRPSLLVAEIETAKQKQSRAFGPAVAQKDPVPQDPTKGQALGTNNNVSPVGATGNTAGGAPGTMAERANLARQYLADARYYLQRNNIEKARLAADAARSQNVALNQPGDDNPEAIYREIRDRMAARGQPSVPGLPIPLNPNNAVNSATPVQPMAPPGATVRTDGYAPGVTEQGTVRGPGNAADGTANSPLAGPNAVVKGMTLPPSQPMPVVQDQKAMAQALVAQARQLQKDNRLIEARQKALEAQQLRAPFAPSEDSPELAIQQLAALARQRTDTLIRDASAVACYETGAPPERFAKAEQLLTEARQLAQAFGQDTEPVDHRFRWLAEQRIKEGLPGLATAQNNVPYPPQTEAQKMGLQLLTDARLDLRAGKIADARVKATRAAEESYGVRELALALIRNIDVEENNLHLMEERRAFGAATQAYNRRDYTYAASLLKTIDPHLLDKEMQDRLKNIMNTPEMAGAAQQLSLTGLASNNQPGQSDVPGPIPPSPVPVAAATSLSGDAGSVNVADQRRPTLLESTAAMREIKFQQLRDEGMAAMREATEKFRVGQSDEALELLQKYLETLNTTQLDPLKTSMLRRPVESRLSQFRILKAQREFRENREQVKNSANNEMAKKASMEEKKEQTIRDQMKQFNEYYRTGKYAEAESAARKVLELDPDNSVAAAGVQMAHMQKNIHQSSEIKKNRADWMFNTLEEADTPPPSDIASKDITLTTDSDRIRRQQRRPGLSSISATKTGKEREIENRLLKPINLNFNGTPLGQVLDDLRSYGGINIWIDEAALLDEGISLNTPVSIKLEQVSLKSALTLLLRRCQLTYIVKDEVVQITTKNGARGKMKTVTYLVADLVLPVENFRSRDMTPNWGYSGSAGGSMVPGTPPSPVELGFTMHGGAPVGAPTPGYQPGGGAAMTPPSNTGPSVTIQNARNSQEGMLIDLIKHAVEPHSWQDIGGPGSIDYHPLTMALVVNQSPDIQEQIAQLLAALRRLQDQEVAVEVKVVSIADDFYEVMGVNFNFNIPTNSTGLATAINGGFQPNRLISGITPAGTLTNDLSIPVTASSFQNAFLPFFSGPNPAYPGLGGINVGLAFLSEIQVFLFMEAAQSDTRTNVMQAPKVTLFNGQTATVQVFEENPYVGNVQVSQSNGQVIFQPIVTPLTTGVQLTIQAVISADRRFVRMSLQPQFQNIAVPGPPTAFPVVVPVFPIQGPPGMSPTPVVFTQYLQQQATQQITVGTTVAVPDGGTVVMGGLKTVSESRTEYGPPFLSNIPYIDRLFKNVAYGRDSASLLIMVTPRIIIMEEEQEYQTGYHPEPEPIVN